MRWLALALVAALWQPDTAKMTATDGAVRPVERAAKVCGHRLMLEQELWRIRQALERLSPPPIEIRAGEPEYGVSAESARVAWEACMAELGWVAK